jgi:hypothetical protein
MTTVNKAAGERTGEARPFVGRAVQRLEDSIHLTGRGRVADFLAVNANPDETAVREMLSGPMCRCIGYTTIVPAALAAAAEMSETATTREGAGV